MYMTDAEIVRSYINAKKKKKQISIISQLNGCNEDRIKNVLMRNGVGDWSKKK